MEAILYVLAAICLILGVVKAYSHSKEIFDFELVAKTCGSMTFVCIGIFAFYLSQPAAEDMRYGLAIIVGLILGMLGDIFLCLYDVKQNPQRKNMIQTVGIIFFFLGHICYMFNFLTLQPIKLYLLPIVAILPIVYVILAAKKVLTTTFIQNVMLTIYYCALGVLLMSSINLIVLNGATAFTIVVLIATVLFISSDTVLGLSWFAPKAKLHKDHDYYIILSYYAAQCLFAMSIYFIG